MQMKIDLCKLLGVEEGEEFTRDDSKIYYKYRVYNNKIQHFDETLNMWEYSTLTINTLVTSEIIKLPKKKKFTDDELSVLRNIDTKYKWLARDKYREMLYAYKEKPEKTEDRNWKTEDRNGDSVGWCSIGIFNHLFNSIQWEDEEPVFIDEYVER